MFKKGLLFFLVIILLGFLDWLTTIIGVLFFGSVEINPFFSGIVRSSIFIFSLVKLSAVILAGCSFYKAEAIYAHTKNHWHYTKSFLYGGFSLMSLGLTAVVASNMIVLIKV
jgi:phage-related holin